VWIRGSIALIKKTSVAMLIRRRDRIKPNLELAESRRADRSHIGDGLLSGMLIGGAFIGDGGICGQTHGDAPLATSVAANAPVGNDRD
jgi:hypothetical protein